MLEHDMPGDVCDAFVDEQVRLGEARLAAVYDRCSELVSVSLRLNRIEGWESNVDGG